MVWVQLILAVLQVADKLLAYFHDQGQIQAGTDAALAAVSQSILAKTAIGKAMLDKVTKMTDKEVDDALKNLEPKG